MITGNKKGNPRLKGGKLFWTDEAIAQDAKRFMYRSDWCKFSIVAYTKSIKDKVKHAANCAHMLWSGYYKNPPPKPRGYWTKERVLEEGRKYKSFSEWKKNSSPSYLIAYAKGWQGELASELYSDKFKACRGKMYWTAKRVIAHVSRYIKIKSVAEFKRNDRKVYNFAKKHRILTECAAIIRKNNS